MSKHLCIYVHQCHKTKRTSPNHLSDVPHPTPLCRRDKMHQKQYTNLEILIVSNKWIKKKYNYIVLNNILFQPKVTIRKNDQIQVKGIFSNQLLLL